VGRRGIHKSEVKGDKVLSCIILYRFFEMLFSKDTPPFIKQEFMKACSQEDSIFKKITKVKFNQDTKWLSKLQDYFEENSSLGEDRKPMEKNLISVTLQYNFSLSLNLLHK
jgi:hypothetical protein